MLLFLLDFRASKGRKVRADALVYTAAVLSWSLLYVEALWTLWWSLGAVRGTLTSLRVCTVLNSCLSVGAIFRNTEEMLSSAGGEGVG